MAKLILTVIGDDRPGLVDALAAAIDTNGGNWEQSRMAHLADKFAGILRVSVADGRLEALREALAALAGQGLQVTVDRAGGEGRPAPGRSLQLELIGQDHPGIVHDIAHALAEHGVSIEELASDTESASMAGGTLFKASVRLWAPETVDGERLRAILEALADELMVDISLDNADADTDR